jgi:hypothetical protein
MIKAEERNETQQGCKMIAQSPVSPSKSSVIPKCVCSWKNCRVYQKFFRDHPVLEGVVRLKFTSTEPESMALKASIDRNLKVSETRAQDRKPGKQLGQEVIKYNVACHHFTEQHIRKFKADPKHYSFIKPFSVHGAAKYLYKVDERETFKDPTGREREPLYLQAPLVPKEAVKNLFYQIKEDTENPTKSQHHELLPDHSEHPHCHQQQSQDASCSKDDLLRSPKPTHTRKNSPTAVGKEDPGTHYSPEDDKKDNTTVSSSRSNKTAEILLQEKEVENKRLKEQLEGMQSQLSFLHDMVSKLQEEHYDHHSTRSGTGGGGGGRHNSRPRRPKSAVAAGGGGGAGGGGLPPTSGGPNDSSRRTGSRSSRSSVPNEIEIEESEDDGGWVEPAIDEEWSEEDEEEESDNDQQSQGTFHVTYQAQRRNSFSSRASRTSRATSIVSASKSVKSLPRDIEIDDDEDDDESHESLQEEAFDNRSLASSKKSVRSGRSFGTMGNRRTSLGVTAKKPHRRVSLGESSRVSTTSKQSKKSSSHNRHGGGGHSEAGSISAVYQVTALTVTDPYGEQGTYTGSISSSTGMPHGFGRLEYDKAGRWYEGDWKHGRWTGQGRLSNGDGDFYEGGLKNDHKHGRGVMKFADGRTFEGEYVNGQMVEGTMTYQDGSTYSGGWADGMRHGRGRCVFTDQSIYEGEFREGEFFGHGKMSWSDGGWYEGEWWNGDMQGFGKEVRPDGSLRHEGQWAKGQPIRK